MNSTDPRFAYRVFRQRDKERERVGGTSTLLQAQRLALDAFLFGGVRCSVEIDGPNELHMRATERISHKGLLAWK